MFCPMTKEDCKMDCAWFAQGDCAITRLHDVADKLEEVVEVVDCLEALEKTITNKEF